MWCIPSLSLEGMSREIGRGMKGELAKENEPILATPAFIFNRVDELSIDQSSSELCSPSPSAVMLW